MASKLISIPSYVSDVPREPIKLDERSIIIEDEGVSYLAGHAASIEAPNGSRIFGGGLSRPSFRRFVKAAVAATLGEGEHKVSIAFAAAHESLDLFRSGPGQLHLSSENEEILANTINEIKFKTGNSDSAWKICRVNIENRTHVFHECQAVTMAIPNQLKNYFVWQLGHGDLQQAVMIDSRPMRSAFVRREGMAGAIRKFQGLTGLSTAEAERAWRSGRMPKPGGMNGETVDISSQKKQALSLHFSPIIGDMVNALDPYKDRLKNGVLSGGGAIDEMVQSFLKSEIEASRYFKLHLISELPVKDERCENPLYTCVHGLLSTATLGLDIGNNSLKAGLV